MVAVFLSILCFLGKAILFFLYITICVIATVPFLLAIGWCIDRVHQFFHFIKRKLTNE